MIYRMLALGAAALALLGAQPAAAQLFLEAPDYRPGPITADDPLVGLPLPGATPAEYRAGLLWNLRAGLNVAALQCQFSPLLRTVDNYNSILAHHNKELADAYAALGTYFKRAHGSAPKGQKAFDDYTTSTYNNFSTLYAQNGFCQTAADIAKDALLRPKGQLAPLAEARMRELRNSLVPAGDRFSVYSPRLIRLPTLPPLDDECYDKRGNLKARCANASFAATAR